MIAKVYHVKDTKEGLPSNHPKFPYDYEWVADVEASVEDNLDDIYRLTHHTDHNWTTNKEVILFNTEDEDGPRSTCVGDIIKLDKSYYICRRSGWDVINPYYVPYGFDADPNDESTESLIIRSTYVDGVCPDCGENIPLDIKNGQECENCGHVFSLPPVGPQITTFSRETDGTGSGNLVVDMSDISPGAYLEIHISHEGIIYDYWEQDPNAPIGHVRFVGSNAKMYTEIAEDIIERLMETTNSPQKRNIMKKQLHKTVITVEVLSEDAFDFNDLSDINYHITEGDCSGKYFIAEQTIIEGKEAADAVMEQGSDPEFFGMDEDGNDTFED